MSDTDGQRLLKLAAFASKLKQWEENAPNKVEAYPPSINRAYFQGEATAYGIARMYLELELGYQASEEEVQQTQ